VSTSSLRLAIVLATTEASCDVMFSATRSVVPYASFFPAPRVDRVAAGQLVAVAGPADSPHVVWRWFDAVVIEQTDDEVKLWEPAHGVVGATPRDPQRTYRPGSRAYLSAGLPDAEWWVAGPAVIDAADADVELGAVESFLAGFGLLTD
jgi:hypothetical protein